MTDGNTHAIAQHLDEREDWDALQEVTTELEQAEARIEELEAKLSKSEALLANAVALIKFLDKNYHFVWSYTTCFKIRTTLTELTGGNDE